MIRLLSEEKILDRYRRIFLFQIVILIAIVFAAFTEKYLAPCCTVAMFSVLTIGELLRLKKDNRR